MVKEIRVDYRDGGPIIIPNANKPLDTLKVWINEAVDKNLIEANAMCLSTVGEDGSPRSRIVLLKHINDTEIGFFTNMESDKAYEIKINENVAATFFWPLLEKQVRILGKASKLPREIVSEYHNSRPRLSQIAAYTSSQSRELDSISTLDYEFRKTEKEFEGKEIPLPNHWGGYKIVVQSIEYWSGRPSRLHERVSLRFLNDQWVKKRLYP
jgi:pyridoxamine 5'-phosphate oxidase